MTKKNKAERGEFNVSYISFGVGERATSRGQVFYGLLAGQDNFILINSFGNYKTTSLVIVNGVFNCLKGKDGEVELLMATYKNKCIIAKEFADILFGKRSVKRAYKKLETKH